MNSVESVELNDSWDGIGEQIGICPDVQIIWYN